MSGIPSLGYTVIKTQTGRCTGHCCRILTLSASREQIAQGAALARYGLARGWPVDEMPEYEYDALFVDRFMVHVRDSYVDAYARDEHGELMRHNQPKLSLFGKFLPPTPRPQFRCTALSADGKNCTRYEERPGFCRRYAADGVCTATGCTLRVVHEGYEYQGPPSPEMLADPALLEDIAGQIAARRAVEAA